MAKYGKTLLIIGILFLVGNLVWFFYEYVKLGPRTYNRLQNSYWNITFTPSYIALGLLVAGGFCIALSREIPKGNQFDKENEDERPK